MYADDVNLGMLNAQLEIAAEERDVFCFYHIVVKIKELPTSEGKIINKVISVCKLILVNLAKSESG